MYRIPNVNKSVLNLTLSLYNNKPHVPRNVVDDVVSSMADCISESYIPHLQEKIRVELDDPRIKVFSIEFIAPWKIMKILSKISVLYPHDLKCMKSTAYS